MAGAISRAAARTISRSFGRGRRGSGLWLAVAVVTWGLRQLVRLSRRNDEVVFSETLSAGETLNITHLHEDFGS